MIGSAEATPIQKPRRTVRLDNYAISGRTEIMSRHRIGYSLARQPNRAAMYFGGNGKGIKQGLRVAVPLRIRHTVLKLHER